MAFNESSPTTIHSHSGGASAFSKIGTGDEVGTYSADQQGDSVFDIALLANGSEIVLSATNEQVTSNNYGYGGYASFQANLIDSTGKVTTKTLSFASENDLTGKTPYAVDVQMVALTGGGFVLAESLVNDNYDANVSTNLYYEILDNNANVVKSWTQVNVASGSTNVSGQYNDFFQLQAESNGGFDIKYLTNDEQSIFLTRYSSAGATTGPFLVSNPVNINGFNATATDTANDVAFTFSSLSDATADSIKVLNASNGTVVANTSLGSTATGALHSAGLVGLSTGGFLQILDTRSTVNNTVSYNLYARTVKVASSTVTFGTLALIQQNASNYNGVNLTALSNGDVAISISGGAYQQLRPSALPTDGSLATLPTIFGTLSPNGAMLATNYNSEITTYNSPTTHSYLNTAAQYYESPVASDGKGGLIAALQTGTRTEYYGVADASLYVADFSPPPPTLALTASTTEPVQGGAAVAVLAGQPTIANAITVDGATITIAGGQAGDTLSISGLSYGTVDNGKVTVTGSGTGTLTLAGTDTPAAYQALLSQITIQYGSSDTDTVSGAHPTRQVSFTVTSGGITSSATPVTVTLDRVPVAGTFAAAVAAGQPVSGSILSVVTDRDGDQVVVKSIATSGGKTTTTSSNLQGSYGTLNVGSNGSYTYAANTTVAASTGSHPTDGFTASLSDNKGGTATETLNFSLDRAPGTPADSNTAANIVAEGAATGTTVGVTAQAIDPDGDAVSYSITNDGSSGGFAINASTGVVTVANGAKLDYASASGHSYTITVQASDGTLVSNQVFAVAVADVTPTISGSSGAQSTLNGTTLAPFAHVVIGEPGSATQIEAVTVRQTEITNGSFTAASLSASGFKADATTAGQYDFSGTAAQDTTAIEALVYQPTPAPAGTTLTTHFTIVVGDGTLSASDSSTSVTVPCFAGGTLIRTERGEVPVEILAIGDVIVTAAGQHRPVKWLGHRVVDCARHPDPAAVMPVRIDAGAFGAGLPNRDLWVSPGHAVCAPGEDGVLIPAQALCNGATVQQMDVERITYWHVELDSHDILLANGLPAESYMDVGNRRFFAEAGAVDLHATPDGVAGSLADYCRPFVEAGPLVEAARAHLRARAVALGWVQAAAPLGGAYLLVAGRRVDPAVDGSTLRFALPRDAGPVWLVSDAVSPHDVAASGDLRRLGLDIRGIRIESAGEVALDDSLLCVGWHGLEDAAGTPHRWTSGRALLPAALWHGHPGPLTLRIDLAGPSVAGWQAPDLDPVEQARAA